MKRHIPIALVISAACATLGVAASANAQQNASASVDPSFTAYSLAQQCAQKSDNTAQGQCVGAVRGIVRGYQYGVLFLGQRASLPANETQRVSLCLNDVKVSAIVDDFLADAKQVKDDDLKRTPAEVAVLGSVHSHHACM
ncbi:MULTISPECIES: Rap1a/Tai family immunity protein [unclassified Caballeronia]|uniref:Rap1a/Tai family immunity protein n=1 Tax=unclassified Caballeronia TaxID=2646786 RepID=UPI00285B436E|nr:MULTISPECIES: Rap1a/Tai family immunity protein [unclassified Caballeronia]MDR5749739.1 Rap1a/Tai family immunity protein [Caballeronia sp. LZ024]MDR5843132.1 Rap1a/Tai family immunity protein [Caballeronia sp. LZ031]